MDPDVLEERQALTMQKNLWIASFIGLMIVLLAGCVLQKVPPASPQVEWPMHGWQTSTPEQQGMDSGKLVKLFDFIMIRKPNLHSLLIVRNGYLVTEAYFFPYQADTLHSLNSCTKSVSSALIGMAIDQGLIRGVDQRLVSFFPGRTIANLDARKQAITLKDLLSMTSGLDWPEWSTAYTSPENIIRQMLLSPDPIQFVLDRPMETDPGTLFNYDTGGSNLLSAILEQKAGKNALDFARLNLFEPLGISKVFWATAQNGMYRGGEGLLLTPGDMAKFGYLYLQRGAWEGRQVISKAWIEASTTEQISTGSQAYAGNQYGYQWWLGWMQSPRSFVASGYGGQYIFVIPEKNMVVVFTGELSVPAYDDVLPKTLTETYILPAVQSDRPLPANPQAAGHLTELIQTVSQPHPQPVPALPALAAQVSGRTYVFDPNERGFQSFSLIFTPGAETAHLFWKIKGRRMDLLVGLEDVFRLTKLGPLDTAALAEPDIYGFNAAENSEFSTSIKGGWLSENTFQMNFQILGYSFGSRRDFTFTPDGVDVSMTNLVDDSVAQLHARPQSP
jgi:CubicO group peptidase (beta-lactamase class C family)